VAFFGLNLVKTNFFGTKINGFLAVGFAKVARGGRGCMGVFPVVILLKKKRNQIQFVMLTTCMSKKTNCPMHCFACFRFEMPIAAFREFKLAARALSVPSLMLPFENKCHPRLHACNRLLVLVGHLTLKVALINGLVILLCLASSLLQ